jgi:uncharacterized protein YggU (UPF0235/DUF167 family)
MEARFFVETSVRTSVPLEPAKSDDLAAEGAAEWRLDAAEYEGAAEAHLLELLTDDAGLERREVELEVGEFGHPRSLARRRALSSPLGAL